MKKYKVKDLKKINFKESNLEGISGELKMIKKFVKSNIEKCKVEDITGYEYIIESNNLELIKTKSNKKNK